ncbi:MAG: 4Fe-4S dicluster domain-containing protein [Desulfobacterales bacterium]|jgi:electron transport complex protein RnfC
MINNVFSRSASETIHYELLHQTPQGLQHITSAETAVLLIEEKLERQSQLALKVGDSVQTGQKIVPFSDRPAYAISSVTGTVAAIRPMNGDFGKHFTAIDISLAEAEIVAEGPGEMEPTLANLTGWLAGAPGNPPLHLFAAVDHGIHTLVVAGVDADLLVATNQFVIKSELEAVNRGIDVLKSATGVDQVAIAVPRDLVQGFGHTGASELKAVAPDYPAANPKLIIYEAFGREIPAGKSCEDMGFAFFSAEAVASIGKAFATGRVPHEKTITLVDKNGRKTILSARIGTPIADVLAAHGIETGSMDRLVTGGPMTGMAIFDEQMPIKADTDAILVQDASDVSLVSDYPCINCGECVRACPTRVPVNMLVRFLEAGQYEEGADLYDLYSCVDCGLCSFVCVARIPIFQYIKLAKYELSRLTAAEASNEQ